MLSIFVVGLAILSPLTTSQVDQKQLARILDPFFMDLYLAHSMTSARGIVSLGRMSGPHTITESYQVQNFFLRLHKLLFEALDLDFLALIF